MKKYVMGFFRSSAYVALQYTIYWIYFQKKVFNKKDEIYINKIYLFEIYCINIFQLKAPFSQIVLDMIHENYKKVTMLTQIKTNDDLNVQIKSVFVS